MDLCCSSAPYSHSSDCWTQRHRKVKLLCEGPDKGCGEGFNATVIARITVGVNPDGSYRGVYDDRTGGDFDPFNGDITIEKILEVQCGCCGGIGEITYPGNKNK